MGPIVEPDKRGSSQPRAAATPSEVIDQGDFGEHGASDVVVRSSYGASGEYTS